MELRDYLHRERMKAHVFAAKIGYDPSYVNRVSLGYLHPGRKLAEKIKEATNGEVVYTPRERILCEECAKLKIEKQKEKQQQSEGSI